MWTGKSISFIPNKDGMTATLVYEITDGAFTQSIIEPLVSTNDPTDLIDNAATARNRIENQKALIASIDPKQFENISLDDLKARKLPPPLSQDELDKQAWFALKQDYQIKLKAFGLSKVITSIDVDNAYAAMKSAYKEEYGAFL